MPDVRVEVAFDSGVQTAAASRTWTDISAYVELDQGITITRGRGDEMATADADQLTLTLDNSDGRFTPERSASPYYPNVKIGRPIRVRARAPWANYLTDSGVATDMESGITGWSTLGGSTLAQSTTQAWQGTNSLRITWPTASTAGTTGATATVTGLTVGQSYTFTAYVWRSAGPQVWLEVNNYSGTTSTVTSGWERLNCGFVASSSTATVRVVNAGASTAGQLCYVDGAMFNRLGVIPFSTTGTVTRFTGFVDEWPLEWDGSDAYARATLTASSRLARLGSGVELKSIIEQEILPDNPVLYFMCNDPEGSLTALNTGTSTDVTYATITGSTTNEKPTFGVSDNTPVGASYTAVKFPGNNRYLQATSKTGPFVTPATGVTIEAFHSQPLDTSLQVRVDDGTTGPSTVAKNYVAFGTAQDFASPTGSTSVNGGAATAAVNTDHVTDPDRVYHTAVTVSATGTISLYADGVLLATAAGGAFSAGTGFNTLTFSGFMGTFAHVAVYNTALSATRIAAHANAGLSGFGGETPAARLTRYAGYVGIPSTELTLDTGKTVALGHTNLEGQAVVDVMRAVETTEGGILFDGRDGNLTFHDRDRRQQTLTSAFTLSAATQQVEADVTPKYDRASLLNDVTATLTNGTAEVEATDATSISDYGYAKASFDIMSTTDAEAHAAAWWRVNRYKDPSVRIPNLSVDLLPLSSTLQESVATADISTRFTVSGLPTQASASSVDFFIEGYTETFGPETWTQQLNVSPASVSTGVFILDSATLGQLDNDILGF